MSDFLPFVIAGIVSGSIYGLAAAGLVLTYKTSGLLNFGHGAIATMAAYCFYWLHVTHGLDWKLAAAISVFLLGPLTGFLMQVIARHLAPQRAAWQIVGTVGLVLIVQGLGSIKYGSDTQSVEPFLPGSSSVVNVLGVNVSYDQLTIIAISLIVVSVLFAYFRYARGGVAMRAVVDNPDLLDMMGTNAARVRRVSWIIGSTFAALSGVLVLPIIGLSPIGLTFLVVSAFAAAALGFFSNIPVSYLGGIVIGILSAVPIKYVVEHPNLGGLPDSVPFLILFAVLIVSPRRKLMRTDNAAAQRNPWAGPPWQRGVGSVVVAGFLVLVPTFAGTHLSAWTLGLTQMILFLSLGLLVRTAGQISLCHAAFAAVGAVAFSQFTLNLGIPWFFALILAGLVAVPLGAVVAIPAMRLHGVFLALATLGFGIMLERLFYPANWMFTITATAGKEIRRPSFASSDEQYYYLVFVIVVVVALVVAAINHSRLGRLSRGLAESPVAIVTLGLSVNVTRTLIFCISAFLAAIAGVLYGGLVHYAIGSDVYFSSFTSLILVVTLALMPMRDPWYAVIAGLTAVIPSYISGSETPYWMNVIFGVFAVQAAMQGGPLVMPDRLRVLLRNERRPDSDASRGAPLAVPTRERAAASVLPDGTAGSGWGLEVVDLTVGFGGLVAVRDLTLRAPGRRITGLIGPNGAGKTTTFNACSGITRPSSGSVWLHGVNVSGDSPAHRARAGLGRTFQLPELGQALTVLENVALGSEAGRAGARVDRQLFASPSDRRVQQNAAWHALELCGITQLADRLASVLSTGQRRLVELARCLAGSFDMLLLDEPSSGLDHEETVAFGDLMLHIVRERGCGILLVEHDMSLVLRVSEHVYVLDSGELLFEGSPSEVSSSKIVQAAYLGTEVVGGVATTTGTRA